MHTIRLQNATFFAHHGVSKEEQQTGGRYEVDVEVKLDFGKAAQEDNLNHTLCYGSIYQIVEHVVQHKKFALIERMAYLIANQVSELSDRIESVEVAVRKRNPPVGGTVDAAEVIYKK